MADNEIPFYPPVKRITNALVKDAVRIRQCINPYCMAHLPDTRTLPVCGKCAAGFNRDDKKTTQQLIEANQRDMRRQGRRQLMLTNETSHVMSLPKNVRGEVKRKEFNVKGFVRITRRVVVDIRKGLK